MIVIIRTLLRRNSTKEIFCSSRSLSHQWPLYKSDELSDSHSEESKTAKTAKNRETNDAEKVTKISGKLSDRVEKDLRDKKSLKPSRILNNSRVPKEWRSLDLPQWKKQKYALKKKFEGETWSPQKRLSREQIHSIRLLKTELPTLNASELSQFFEVSPESIRRILKSKWEPGEEESEKLYERWKRRGEALKELLFQNGKQRKSVLLGSKGNELTVTEERIETRSRRKVRRHKTKNDLSKAIF